MVDPVQFVEEAYACAGLFRLGRDVEAGLRMVELIEAVAPLFDQHATELRQQWSELVLNIFSHQQLQDWLGVADDLQYELVALIGQGRS